jgi:hypothetical protein
VITYIKKKKKNRIFNLAEPTYDFITDSYSTSKPYVMRVGNSQRIVQPKKSSADKDMLDLIDYLGGAQPPKESRRVQLQTTQAKIDFSKQTKHKQYHIDVKLDGGVPGKILNDAKANAFLDRVDYYVRNPTELVV